MFERVILIMIKKVLTLFVLICLVTGCTLKDNSSTKNLIVTTSFPCYDFVRAIVKDTDIEVKMLLKPGMDMHDYEPTPKDIIDIENSLLFVYVGGESDDWVNGVLDSTKKKKTTTFKLIDSVSLLEEEIKPGMQTSDNEKELDEHVWTSPKKAIIIIENLKEKLIEINPKEKEKFESNTNKYIKEIEDIDKRIEVIVKESPRKELIFADRFPIRYFTDEYGLNYYAAFPGCAHEVEANAKTISFLIAKVRQDKVPAVFSIELSNKSIANIIRKETGVKILTFETAHNITKDDFESKVTYVDLMERNIGALKEALK